ncbi:MAG: hypothetical protein KKF12_18395, partial [Proteobacteria bacterium]|nr:hypothetical protein [Pseudomonadota bacterium]
GKGDSIKSLVLVLEDQRSGPGRGLCHPDATSSYAIPPPSPPLAYPATERHTDRNGYTPGY